MTGPAWTRGSVLNLLRLAAPVRRPLAVGSVLALLQSAVWLLLPVAVGRLADITVAGASDARLGALIAGLAVLLVAHAAASFGGRYLVSSAQARIAADLRERLHARLLQLPLRWFDRRGSGELVELVDVEVENAASFASEAPGAALPILLTVVGALVMMIRIDAVSALLVAAAIPAVLLTVRRLARPVPARAVRTALAYGRFLSAFQESFEHLLTVKAFSAERSEAARVRRASRSLLRSQKAQLASELSVAPVAHALAVGVALGVVTLSQWRGSGAALAPGALVSLILYAVVLTRPLRSLAELGVGLQQARAARERLAAIWRTRPEPRTFSVAMPRPLRGAVEFCGVHFRHPGRAPTLCGVDLRIDPGEFVALVGANGTGKTTLVRLLLRFQEPYRGCVRLDGRDVRALDRDEMRRAVGFADQHAQLFDRTIRDNIRLGWPDAPPAEVEAAARRAGADEFVRTLPSGYDTQIGERGVALSGGQRQRIALARALLGEPRVLVLDEATSMFDADGEVAFLQRNRDWLADRTVLLITHRPASLVHAHRVFEMRKGRVHAFAPGARTRWEGSIPRAPGRAPGSPRDFGPPAKRP